MVLWLCPLAWASSGYSSQMADMRGLQQSAVQYRYEYGALPVTDETGTWFQKLAIWQPDYVQILDFGTTPDGSFPLDMYGHPLVYELPLDPATELPIIRAVGENGIDDGGKLDDWDIRFEPNLGYWYKTEWPAVYRRAEICVVLAAMGLLLMLCWRRSRRRIVTLGLIWIGVLAAIVLPAGFDAAPRSSASSIPKWVDTIAFIGQFMILAGLISSIRMLWIAWREARQRRMRGCCKQCGYDLRGTIIAGRQECPECGAVTQGVDLTPEQRQSVIK